MITDQWTNNLKYYFKLFLFGEKSNKLKKQLILFSLYDDAASLVHVCIKLLPPLHCIKLAPLSFPLFRSFRSFALKRFTQQILSYQVLKEKKRKEKKAFSNTYTVSCGSAGYKHFQIRGVFKPPLRLEALVF